MMSNKSGFVKSIASVIKYCFLYFLILGTMLFNEYFEVVITQHFSGEFIEKYTKFPKYAKNIITSI